MPLPKVAARFNRVVTNRVLGPLAPRLPGFGVLIHRGRVSGKEYRTPVNCWVDERNVIIALTYGRDTDWLKNMIAASGGAVVIRGREHPVGPPLVIGEEGMKRMPALVRPILRGIHVGEFAELPLVSRDRPT